MPELRKDPVVGRWVIIATERARRPGTLVDKSRNVFDPADSCPFCDNHDPIIFTIPAKKGKAKSKDNDWKIRVTPSGTPLLNSQVKSTRTNRGIYEVFNDFGEHEIVIETPEHIANMADMDSAQIKLVLDTYVMRINELEKNPSFKYVMAFKNYGWSAGSRSIGHARSQLIATSVVPLNVKEKLEGARKYYNYHDRCVYCDLINQERDANKRIVAENENFIAVTPFAPRFVFEIWILPKRHHCDFNHGVIGFEKDLADILKEVLLRLKIGLDDPAYNYVIHTAPFQRDKTGSKWRTIEDDFHWHIEVMPRLSHPAGFEKGTGFYICAIPPEDTAAFLREVEIGEVIHG